MPGVLQQIVPGERARPLGVGRGRRQDRLLEHELRAPVAADTVHAADERREDDEPRPRRDAREKGPCGARERQRDEQPAFPEPRARDRRDERRDRGSRETGAEDDAGLRRVEPARGEVEPEQHAEEPRRGRAEERGGVEPAPHARARSAAYRAPYGNAARSTAPWSSRATSHGPSDAVAVRVTRFRRRVTGA